MNEEIVWVRELLYEIAREISIKEKEEHELLQRIIRALLHREGGA